MKPFRASEFQPDFGIPWVPVLPRSTFDDWSLEEVANYVKIRNQTETNAINNPVGAGWTLPMWQMVMKNFRNYRTHCILGGNRSGKSVFASRLAVWAACTIPEAQVRMYHVNLDRSIQDQQMMVWDAIPNSIKNIPSKKGQYFNLQFNQRSGFTGQEVIFPPLPGYRKGGSIIFGNYRQYQQDEQVAEGFRAHAIFCDEECPAKLFETLLYRTIDLDGKIFLTFTTLQGWTPLIQDLLGKTQTLVSGKAPLLNNRPVPIMQKSLSRENTAIYYFHTAHNPFIESADFLKELSVLPKDVILARAYGIPTKSITGAFPSFNKEVHIIEHEKLPFIKDPKYKVTRYMAIDPGGSKNWFLCWVAIDAAGTWWVYREWPDYDDWALPGNTAEGKPGPAQKGSRNGIKDYVELIRQCEGEEQIYERLIDPRMGAAEKQSEDGATTIISDLDAQDMTVIPAPGVDIDNGLMLIKSLLKYDDNKPLDSMNSPKIYFSDRCQNIIYAMSEYTAQGGRNENTKDCIDTIRYLAVSNIQYIEEHAQNDASTYGRTASY